MDLDRGSIEEESARDRTYKTGHRARARQATVWRHNKNRAGRRARTGQATRQGQDRPQCGATGQGRNRRATTRLAAQGKDKTIHRQGNGKTGQNVTPQGKARAGHRARTGQITATHWARRGQAAGQGQGRPQGKGRSLGKNRTSRRPRTRQVTGQGHWQDRSQCDATDAGQGRAGQVCHSPERGYWEGFCPRNGPNIGLYGPYIGLYIGPQWTKHGASKDHTCGLKGAYLGPQRTKHRA